MAKRFTDTEKWKKKWFRKLQEKHKLLFLYLLDQCNHAGIWPVDLELAGLYIYSDAEKYPYDESSKAMQKQIIPFQNNERWFLVDFSFWQQNSRVHELSPNDRHQGSVLREYAKSPELVELLIVNDLIEREDFINKLKFMEDKYKKITIPYLRGIDGATKGHRWGKDAPLDKDIILDTTNTISKNNNIASVNSSVTSTSKKKNKKKEKEKKKKTSRFIKPTTEEAIAYFEMQNYIDPDIEGEKFWNYYENNEWRTGRSRKKMKNWKLAASNWNLNNKREQKRLEKQKSEQEDINQRKWKGDE